jgi:uncharacterized membrane protein
VTWLLLAAAPFAPVGQEYLFEARQMQALSFAVHIPLVCFGIAFPAFVLFMEALWLRTGDPVFRTIAKRWSKVMLALFAVGVVTGTILSFDAAGRDDERPYLWRAELVAHASTVFTLEAGDLILTGTRAGVGIFRDPPVALADEVEIEIEIEIEGIGILWNPVVREDTA